MGIPGIPGGPTPPSSPLYTDPLLATPLTSSELNSFESSISSARGSITEDRVSIFSYLGDTLGRLVDLLSAWKAADQQGDTPVLMSLKSGAASAVLDLDGPASLYETHKAITAAATIAVKAIENEKQPLIDAANFLNSTIDSVFGQGPRDALNAAINTYNANPSAAGALNALNNAINNYNALITVYNNAATAFNSEVDHFNSLITTYNSALDRVLNDVNPERTDVGLPNLSGLSPFPLLPSSIKRPIIPLVSSAPPAPAQVTYPNPAHIPPFIDHQQDVKNLANQIGVGSTDFPSGSLADAVRKKAEDLNAALNKLDPILFDIEKARNDMASAETDAEYAAAATRYNSLVTKFNNARDSILATVPALNNAITNYNNVLLSYNQFINNAYNDTTGTILPITNFGTHTTLNLITNPTTLLPALTTIDPNNSSHIVPPSPTVDIHQFSIVGLLIPDGALSITHNEYLLAIFPSLAFNQETTENLLQLLETLSTDKNLFYFLFTEQAKAYGDIHTDSNTEVGNTNTSSNSASSLISMIMGLDNNKIGSALSQANFAFQVKSLTDSLNFTAPKNIANSLVKLTSSIIIDAAGLAMKPSIRLALDLLRNIGLESTPITLALFTGLLLSATDQLKGGDLHPVVGELFKTLGLQSQEQEVNAFSRLTTTAVLSLLLSEVVRAAGSSEGLVAAINLPYSLAVTTTIGNVNNFVKSTLQGKSEEEIRQLSEELKKAGLPAGILQSENPDSLLTSPLLRNVFIIALLNPELASGKGPNPFALGGTPEGQAALVQAGLTPSQAGAFLGLTGSFVENLSSVEKTLGHATTAQGILTLSSLQVGASISERLTGELSTSQGQTLTKEIVKNIFSTLNVLQDVLHEAKEKGNLREIDIQASLFHDTLKSGEDMSTQLDSFIDPAKNFLKVASVFHSGSLPQPQGGTRAGFEQQTISIQA